MYTMDYLNLFIDTLQLPEDSCEPLRRDYTVLLNTEGAVEELETARVKMLQDANWWKELVPYMDKVSEMTGLHRHVVDFLFLMASSEQMREDYKAAGLSDELFWETIADLKYKLIECHTVYGIWGMFVAFWHAWFFQLRRFKLGRLQYEPYTYEGEEPVTIGDYTVNPGDTVYNMHIPSCGPFPREARIDSYKQAYEFFKKDLNGKPMVFVCHSWLLFLGNREILPASLNMVDFINDFRIIESNEVDDFGDKWRVFGADFQKPDAELPEDTTMRRCFKKWLLDGKKTGEGFGVFVYDGENFIK
ncbi:MAG: DUF5596 domain-containing protein [Clostridia bacterium]|nr:DUF5596 domain-containing protein [Clostridia bacterium]